MSGIRPTDERLRAIEQRVLTRIRRRAAIRSRIASGAVVAALVVGTVVLLPPALGTLTTSAGSAAGGSAASDAKGAAAGSAPSIRCHLGGEGTTLVPLPARPSARTVAAACTRAAARPGPTPGSTAFVACRDADGTWEAFPEAGYGDASCTRSR
ncbi:MAG: hypothetical protein ACTHJL_07595 [Amnibacterium sp.]